MIRSESAGSVYVRDPSESLGYNGKPLSLFTPWPLWPVADYEGFAGLSVIGTLSAVAEVVSTRVGNYRGSGTNFGSFWNLWEWTLR